MIGVKHIIGMVILFGAFALTSCKTAENLAEGQTLYTGSRIDYSSASNFEDPREMRSRLHEYLAPEPNKLLFGSARSRLWIYQKTKEPKKEKGIRNFLKYKLGESPVLLREVKASFVRDQLEAELFNAGYFQSTVEYDIIKENRTAEVVYKVKVGTRYHIHQITYPAHDSSLFWNTIDSLRPSSLLTQNANMPYSLDLLSSERQRIQSAMKERGFYYFSESQVLFRADSTIGDHKVNLQFTIDSKIPEKSKKKYTVGTVKVNPFYGQGNVIPTDTVITPKKHTFIGGDSIFRTLALDDYIFIAPNKHYTKSDHDLTLTRLSNLGVFDFVNVVFSEDSANAGMLLADIQLAPTKRRTLGATINLTTKSNGFTGPNVEVNWINRNLFKGAEFYELRLDGGAEAQLLSGGDPLYSFEVGINNELRFPKTIRIGRFPFASKNVQAPQTSLQLGYRLLSRVQFYTMNTGNLSYGYRWRQGSAIQHSLDPLSISYVNITNTTDTFQQRLDANPSLRRSFEQQFIVGSSYSFTYNPAAKPYEVIRFFFKGSIEASGNTLYAGFRAAGNSAPSDDDPYRILDLPFAQYVKTDLDFRSYLNVSETFMLAFRQFLGVGLPYGNGSSMPFIKQYFSGGASSIRAFRFRSLGPGTYQASEDGTYFYLDQAGDMKLETSLELRFPIQNILKGAVFVDAGNVWLLSEDAEKPGGTFQASQFISEIAIGGGAGLRLDLNFFVVRFDLAIPLRKPYLPSNDRWVYDSMRFGDADWRSENLIFNLAIGYPF